MTWFIGRSPIKRRGEAAHLTEGTSVGDSAQTLRCLQLADAPAEYGVFII